MKIISITLFCILLAITNSLAFSDDGKDSRFEIVESNIDPKLISFEDYLTKLASRTYNKRLANEWSKNHANKKHQDLEVEGDPIATHYDPLDSKMNEISPSIVSTVSSKVDDSVLEPRMTNVETKSDKPTETRKSYSSPSVIEQQISQISLQNPEYRMIGPNRTEEILMGDDVGSSLLAALDNMQQEAKEMWGQVSETVEDQWTQLKKAIEGQLDQISKEKSSNTFATRKLQSTGDIGLDIPASVDPGAVSDNKANTFLNNIGISSDAQKKASELISNAGTSIKEVAQKDLPVAYEKAKTALSETVTKDIPNYWNKLFGGNKSN